MSGTSRAGQPPVPPARQLRLLATWAPGAAVAFALLAVWSAVAALRNLAVLLDGVTAAGPASPPLLASILGTVVCALTAAVAGLVAYRLGVEVPRVLHGWRDALAERERSGSEPGSRPERTGSRTSPR